jgi:hypothetical protein
VGYAGRYEHGCAGKRFDLPVDKSKRQSPFQNMPGFIVGVMNVKIVR